MKHSTRQRFFSSLMLVGILGMIGALAFAQTQPATQPTTQPVRPTIQIPADVMNLNTLCASMTPGADYIESNPLKIYSVTPTLTIPKNCASSRIVGRANPLRILPGNGGRVFDSRNAPGFSLSGFHVVSASSAQTGLWLAGPLTTIADCVVMIQMGAGCEADYPSGNGATFRNIVFQKPTGGQAVYINGADSTLTDSCLSPGSIGEVCYRINPAEGGHVPTHSTLTRSTFNNSGSGFNKPAAQIRGCDGLDVSLCDFTGGFRVGENGSVVVAPTALNVTFRNNRHHPDPRHVWDEITIFAGIVSVDGDLFSVDATQRPISVNVAQGSRLSTNNNTIQPYPGVNPKKLIRRSDGVESNGVNTRVAYAPPQR